MKSGYIQYNDKIVYVEVIKESPSYKILKTEDGDVLEVPWEADICIWSTSEECYMYANGYFSDWVPQEN